MRDVRLCLSFLSMCVCVYHGQAEQPAPGSPRANTRTMHSVLGAPGSVSNLHSLPGVTPPRPVGAKSMFAMAAPGSVSNLFAPLSATYAQIGGSEPAVALHPNPLFHQPTGVKGGASAASAACARVSVASGGAAALRHPNPLFHAPSDTSRLLSSDPDVPAFHPNPLFNVMAAGPAAPWGGDAQSGGDSPVALHPNPLFNVRADDGEHKSPRSIVVENRNVVAAGQLRTLLNRKLKK
jgi:hypothetical protein